MREKPFITEAGLRPCHRCKRLRKLECFSKRTGRGDGLRHECRDCQAEIAQAAYRRNREYLDSVKLERGCLDCGYREHAVALDFDHRPGSDKSFNLNQAGTKSLALLETEMAKCDVRCANCHRVITHARRLEV